MLTTAQTISRLPDELFEKIKDDFSLKFKTNLESGAYHPLDVQRIQKDTAWVRAFYKNSLESHDKTVALINDVLTWRKQFDANSLLAPGKLPFDEALLSLGSIYFKNKDKRGNPILQFVAKTHKKDRYPSEQIRKMLTFFMESVYTFNLDTPIVMSFDMTGSGYANIDLDTIMFLFDCLRFYYPGFIAYIIVYDMPFIFNAVWKIIKNLMPARAVELVKFVDKKTVREFVDADQLPVHMGGTDPFEYSYSRGSFRVVDQTVLQLSDSQVTAKSAASADESSDQQRQASGGQ